MKTIRYVCTHCDRRFEAEEKEIIECPGCFWSTSVKKEEDAGPESVPEKASPKKRGKIGLPSIKINFIPSILFLGIFGAVWLGYQSWPALKANLGSIRLPKIEQEKSPNAQSEKSSPQAVPAQEVVSVDGLSQEEQNILMRRLEVKADREMTEEERQILNIRPKFQTGVIENLPSKAWNLENFKQMLEEQQRFYKVTLPHSYRKKLEDLFTEKYISAAQAFEQGNLLKARDLWIESLAIPMYTNNLQRHRGVVLTMLRAFINDTLSKIGAINNTIAEQKIREKELALSEHYDELVHLIDQKAWPEASAMVVTLNQIFDQLEQPDLVAGASVSYPPAIQQVDQDIQATLAEIQSAPSPAVSDFVPMKRDVEQKRLVIESFLPDQIKVVQGYHDQALEHLRERKWEEAEKDLRQIMYPIALWKDAQEKVKILKKLQTRPPNESSQR